MLWPAPAHAGFPLAPHDLWTAWNLAPSLLLPLALAALVYAWGTQAVWRRAGAGRGITVQNVGCFLGGVLALLVALVSPLDALSGVLFAAHMVQHLVLMLVAAPLLVLSEFPLALVWALPRRQARRVAPRFAHSPVLTRAWGVLSRPASAWLLSTATLWGWHSPALYEAALRDEALHRVEHALFLGTAALFWWVLFRHTRPAHVHYGLAVPYLFTTVLQSTVLSALMTFTSRPWYPTYAALTPTWGLTPMQDQQLAGLVMWLPGGAVYTLLTIGYFAAWLRAMDQRRLPLPRPAPLQPPSRSDAL